jgi:anthranilate synthase component 2
MKKSFAAGAIYLLDFEDSFTYNIVAVLREEGLFPEVIPFAEVSEFLESFWPMEKTIVIYGPGPGAPTDHRDLYPKIAKLLQHPLVFHLGICLGHQLLWNLMGVKIDRIPPVHGQAVTLNIPPWGGYFEQKDWGRRTWVQRYNSLALSGVDPNDRRFIFDQKREVVLAGRFERGLTYQFHPESVGTSDPHIFFGHCHRFLYNDSYGKYKFTH